MTSIPHKFFIKNFEREEGIKLPPPGQYAVGNLFFKPDEETLQESKRQLEEIAESLGLRVLGWRKPPVDSTLLGPAAASREPVILQPFVVLESAYDPEKYPDGPEDFDERLFERQLYILRKRATHTIGLHNWFYLCSLSNKNIVYKGQLAPVQVYQYYHDLVNADYEAHFALVHSRFSTNTFPSWDRAQPLRWAAHNGKQNISPAYAWGGRTLREADVADSIFQAKSIPSAATRIGCVPGRVSCILASSVKTWSFCIPS